MQRRMDYSFYFKIYMTFAAIGAVMSIPLTRNRCGTDGLAQYLANAPTNIGIGMIWPLSIPAMTFKYSVIKFFKYYLFQSKLLSDPPISYSIHNLDPDTRTISRWGCIRVFPSNIFRNHKNTRE